MIIEWEELASNVWLLRGLPPGGVEGISPTVFTVVVVGRGDTAMLLAGDRIDSLEKSRALEKSLRARGFNAASAIRHGKKRLYR